MLKLLYFFLGLLVLFCAISLIWRFISCFWQLPCPAWLGWLVEADNPLSKISRAATIIKNLQLQPGMTILDAGCGPGRVTIPIAQKIGPNGIVVALDLQTKMLKKVKEKAQTLNLNNITLLQAGLGDKKLKPDTYDRIILATVLGEIPDQKAALQEIFNALKPGGILLIAEIIFDPHYQRYNKVLRLATETGFQKQTMVSDLFAFQLLLEKPILEK